MSFEHGTKVVELSTALQATRNVSAAVPFVVGVAPSGPSNSPQLVTSLSEAKKIFGDSQDHEKHTLLEFFDVYFRAYQVRPAVVVNVEGVELDGFTETFTWTDASYQLPHKPIQELILKPSTSGAPVLYSASESPAYVEGVDYSLDRETGVLEILSGSSIEPDSTCIAEGTYQKEIPPADENTIIGTIDPVSGKKTGFELVDQMYFRYGMVPGFLLAPGWSQRPKVARAMSAKAKNINSGLFKCMAVSDLDDSTVKYYSQAGEYKTNNNLADPFLLVCWPRVRSGEKTQWLSSHLVGLMASTDAQFDDVPYVSPSNRKLAITGTVANGQTVWLSHTEANVLNSNGIITALNFGQWAAWGNRSSAYPVETDYKDVFIPSRRMWCWISNKLVLSFWKKVGGPISRNAIESVVVSANAWINGLASDGKLLGGEVVFLSEENPDTDLLNGVTRLHVYALPPPPMTKLEFLLEIDVSAFDALRAQLASL